MAGTARRTIGLFLAVVGMVATAVGLALPWSRAEGPFSTATLSAFDLDDGLVVAALLGVSLVGLVLHVSQIGMVARWSGLASFVCGIAIAGIAVVDIGDVESVETIVQSGGGRIETTVGEGLYLVLGGGIAQVVGMGVVLTRGDRGPYTRAPEAQPGRSGAPASPPTADEGEDAGREAATEDEAGGSLGS